MGKGPWRSYHDIHNAYPFGYRMVGFVTIHLNLQNRFLLLSFSGEWEMPSFLARLLFRHIKANPEDNEATRQREDEKGLLKKISHGVIIWWYLVPPSSTAISNCSSSFQVSAPHLVPPSSITDIPMDLKLTPPISRFRRGEPLTGRPFVSKRSSACTWLAERTRDRAFILWGHGHDELVVLITYSPLEHFRRIQINGTVARTVAHPAQRRRLEWCRHNIHSACVRTARSMYAHTYTAHPDTQEGFVLPHRLNLRIAISACFASSHASKVPCSSYRRKHVLGILWTERAKLVARFTQRLLPFGLRTESCFDVTADQSHHCHIEFPLVLSCMAYRAFSSLQKRVRD